MNPKAPTIPAFRPLIIAAPFGNYLQPAAATATLGTFTAKARTGRAWRILKTVRYYPRLRAWVNKIGLRNPGIEWLGAKVQSGRIQLKDKIVSIHGFDAQEWQFLLKQIGELQPLAVELNISCPNVGEMDWPVNLFAEAIATGVPVIVKLPPVNYDQIYLQAEQAGVQIFHCCNTLPIAAGGLSGQPLKPVALTCIRNIREQLSGGDQVTIIGGGGIREGQDIAEYAAAGAQYFAVASKLFHLRYLFGYGGLRTLLEQAKQHAQPTATS